MGAAWVAEEFASLQVGDARLDARLREMVTRLAARPTASVPIALGDPASVKAAYRLCANPRVRPTALLTACRKATRLRALLAGWVLLVQDTTSLDFTAHKGMDGLGMLEHPASRGVFVHTTLAVSVEGVPLGVVAQELWARDPATRGIGAQRNARPTAEKESQRWLTALAASQQALWGPITTVTIADREGEMYDLWTAPRRPTDHLLLRMKHNRATMDPTAGPHLRDALQQAPVAATLTLTVPRQHKGRHATGADRDRAGAVCDGDPGRAAVKNRGAVAGAGDPGDGSRSSSRRGRADGRGVADHAPRVLPGGGAAVCGMVYLSLAD